MGRRANLLPKRNKTTYEVKLRKPGDRWNGNGHKVEGGKTFSRHLEASNFDQAKKSAQRLAKRFNSRVVSISKVHPEDIIGDFKTWGLKDIIGAPKIERRDVILDNTTLDEIIYKK
jgi:hypothetical protein